MFGRTTTFGRATTSMLIPGRLRSRLIFCVMFRMAQGAHRGRPVAAAPCTPGLRPAKSPLRGTFDLSLQAAGRAEAASLQNTALSPHPCGLPRPSGNVSAILRPPAPAVSVARLIPAGCGSGRGSVPAKHGPQPASMRAAPAFRERLSDFEAASTGSFSRASG